jgi:predicted N-acyltransferase
MRGMLEPEILTSDRFWKILADSGSIDESRGMRHHELSSGSGKLHLFSKTHSYGEYIFDWAWARAFEQQRIPYYPKLLSMVPFTPATSRHFLASREDWPGLLEQAEAHLLGHSSLHFLFTTPEETEFLAERGYLNRDSFQYHFINEGYRDFEDFLSGLKSKKAKQLRQERRFQQLTFERLSGSRLRAHHADEMYGFYLLTLEDKGAIPYLTQDFFRRLFQELPENVLYARALKDDAPLAGALFYFDRHRLYGRYWGSREYVANLHFELCYYQGIDFCLERGLSVFEAGAQGEHKVLRGFCPVLTRSAHRISHPGFHRAIAHFIQEERRGIAIEMEELRRALPFKARI